MMDARTERADDDLIQDETMISVITIGPDGRVFSFGTSRAIVEILSKLCPGDDKLAKLLTQLATIENPLPP